MKILKLVSTQNVSKTKIILQKREEFGAIFEIKIVGKMLIATEKGSQIQKGLEALAEHSEPVIDLDQNLLLAFALNELEFSDYRIERISKVHASPQ